MLILKRRRTIPYELSKSDTGYVFGWDYNGKQSALKWAARESKRRRYTVAVRDRAGSLVAQFNRRGVLIAAMDGSDGRAE